jgi:hypothetical protein
LRKRRGPLRNCETKYKSPREKSRGLLPLREGVSS